MALESFLIGPVTEGQQDDIEPFYLPEDAYFKLEDAYVWRGRLRKRFGVSLSGSTDLNSRLRINLGSTDESGDLEETVPGSIFKIGQMFSIGEEFFTVNVSGSPANMIISGETSLATFDTTSGELKITGSAEETPVYFYPAEPVMGLRKKESVKINKEITIAFDTQFAYEKSSVGWERFGDAVWTGSNSKFFWSTNYRGGDAYETFFYCSNFVSNDHIKYVPYGSSEWKTLRPKLNDIGTDRFLETCRLIINFKDRLVALNTIETIEGAKEEFFSRCRFSQSGDPTNEEKSWIDNRKGRGGFIDAPTKERIVTAKRLKDNLIVYFERSTWELVYTGVHASPFKWQKVNSELGCESTFSAVVFDESILGVGNVGIHGCNGSGVKRVDVKILDEVFKIHNGNDGAARVYGIRDFYNELVYWAFPDHSDNPVYPTKVLVYNYRDDTWAFINDSFTCFGYFQKVSDLTWKKAAEIYSNWKDANNAWGSGLFQSSFPLIVAGNQQGFVFTLDNGKSSNCESLYITDMDAETSTLTSMKHNLKDEDYILIEGSIGVTELNGKVFKVQKVEDPNTFTIDSVFTGTYKGGGNISRVSNLKILTKSFNPGTQIGKKFSIPYVDFLLNKTTSGEVSVNYLLNTETGSSIQEQETSDILLGSNILHTNPERDSQVFQSQIWHRYYIQSQAQFLQLLFFMSDKQMRDLDISQSDFELHAMIFYVETRGALTY